MSEPIIKFKARWNEIERVEVERETEHSVWINGRKRAKESSWESYFDSFDAAKTFLLAGAELDVKRAKEELQRRRTALGNIKSLKP